ncbi:uncharacterized protein LOC144138620 isoform X2 [Haemaphysalis longicornis]
MSYRDPQRSSRSGRSSLQSFACPINHRSPVMEKCFEKVVYEYPMTCGDMYVGETGRCATERLREHARSMDKDSTLARHRETCEVRNCRPMLEKARIVSVHENFYERREAETRRIHHHVHRGTPCVNVLKNPEVARRRDEEYDDLSDRLSRLRF